jgi:hypothetical protein
LEDFSFLGEKKNLNNGVIKECKKIQKYVFFCCGMALNVIKYTLEDYSIILGILFIYRKGRVNVI